MSKKLPTLKLTGMQLLIYLWHKLRVKGSNIKQFKWCKMFSSYPLKPPWKNIILKHAENLNLLTYFSFQVSKFLPMQFKGPATCTPSDAFMTNCMPKILKIYYKIYREYLGCTTQTFQAGMPQQKYIFSSMLEQCVRQPNFILNSTAI